MLKSKRSLVLKTFYACCYFGLLFRVGVRGRVGDGFCVRISIRAR